MINTRGSLIHLVLSSECDEELFVGPVQQRPGAVPVVHNLATMTLIVYATEQEHCYTAVSKSPEDFQLHQCMRLTCDRILADRGLKCKVDEVVVNDHLSQDAIQTGRQEVVVGDKNDNGQQQMATK